MLFLMFVLVIISWPWWLAETSLHKILMDQQWGCRTVGPTSKIPPKIKKKTRGIDGSYLCHQQFDKFWIWSAYNHRKRKLCQSDETCLIKTREITTSELILWLILPILNQCAEAASNKSPSGSPTSPDQTNQPAFARKFTAFKGWRAGLLVELCQRHSATTWRRLLRPNFEAVFEAVSTKPRPYHR